MINNDLVLAYQQAIKERTGFAEAVKEFKCFVCFLDNNIYESWCQALYHIHYATERLQELEERVFPPDEVGDFYPIHASIRGVAYLIKYNPAKKEFNDSLLGEGEE